MRTTLALTLVLLLAPFASGSTLGAYAGVGYSAQYQYGRCQVQGDTSTSLHQNANGSWSFDVHMLHLPIVGCDGLSVGTTSFPSAIWSNDLRGTPDNGFTSSGAYDWSGRHYTWGLVVSPLGLETTWSIHFQWDTEYGPQNSWWNGTATMAGAHV
jgi:hypothetical protein